MKSFVIVTIEILTLVCLFGLYIAPVVRDVNPLVSDTEILFWRMGYAAIVMVAFTKAMKCLGRKYYPERIRNLPKRPYFSIVLKAAACLAVSYFAYTRSFRLSLHLAPALSLGNISVVWVVLLSLKRENVLTLVAACGVILSTFFFLVPGEGGGMNEATIWGLIASFFLAIFLMQADKLPRGATSYAIVSWYCIVGAGMSLFGLLGHMRIGKVLNELTIDFNLHFHLKMLGLGIATALAFQLYMLALKRVSPLIVSAFLVLTPAANSLIDRIFLQSEITSNQVTGVWLVSLGLLTLYLVRYYVKTTEQEQTQLE